MAQLAECFVTAISVQKAVEGIKPKVFQVSIGSCNTVEGLDVDLRMSVEILFDESLTFSEIESLASARVGLFMRS